MVVTINLVVVVVVVNAVTKLGNKDNSRIILMVWAQKLCSSLATQLLLYTCIHIHIYYVTNTNENVCTTKLYQEAWLGYAPTC